MGHVARRRDPAGGRARGPPGRRGVAARRLRVGLGRGRGARAGGVRARGRVAGQARAGGGAGGGPGGGGLRRRQRQRQRRRTAGSAAPYRSGPARRGRTIVRQTCRRRERCPAAPVPTYSRAARTSCPPPGPAGAETRPRSPPLPDEARAARPSPRPGPVTPGRGGARRRAQRPLRARRRDGPRRVRDARVQVACCASGPGRRAWSSTCRRPAATRSRWSCGASPTTRS